MSDGFAVDTASLETFRAAVGRAQDRLGDLQGLVGSASLAPGTFTRTPGGQLADAGHAEMLDGVRTALDGASKRLSAMAEATATTIDNYESTDASHAAAMSDIQGRLDSVGGYQP